MPQGEQDREAASARHVTLTATQQEVLDRMERAVADIVFPFALDSLSMGVLVHELLPDLRQGDVGDIVDTFARDGVLKEQCVDFFRKEGVERGILLERVEQLQALPAEEVQQKGDAYIDWLRADGWPTKFQRQKLQGRQYMFSPLVLAIWGLSGVGKDEVMSAMMRRNEDHIQVIEDGGDALIGKVNVLSRLPDKTYLRRGLDFILPAWTSEELIALLKQENHLSDDNAELIARYSLGSVRLAQNINIDLQRHHQLGSGTSAQDQLFYIASSVSRYLSPFEEFFLHSRGKTYNWLLSLSQNGFVAEEQVMSTVELLNLVPNAEASKEDQLEAFLRYTWQDAQADLINIQSDLEAFLGHPIDIVPDEDIHALYRTDFITKYLNASGNVAPILIIPGLTSEQAQFLKDHWLTYTIKPRGPVWICNPNDQIDRLKIGSGTIHEVEDHQSEAGATLISVFYNHGLEPSIWQLVQYEYLLKYIGVKGYEVRRLFDVDTVVRYPDGKFELVKGGDVLRDYGDGRYVERIKTAAYTGPKIQLT